MLIARAAKCWLAAWWSPLGTTGPPFALTLTAKQERASGDCGILTASDRLADGLFWATLRYKLASRNGWHDASKQSFTVSLARARSRLLAQTGCLAVHTSSHCSSKGLLQGQQGEGALQPCGGE